MNVVGIKPSLGRQTPLKGGDRHDGGACLVRDGEIVAAVEEERFTRNKHALDEFPHHSVRYVLDAGECTLADVDVVAVGRNRSKRVALLGGASGSTLPTSLREVLSLVREVTTLGAVRFGFDVRLVDDRIHESHPGVAPPEETFSGTYETISHHRCHAASAAYCAPVDRPVVVTIDHRGEHDSTVLWDADLKRVKTFAWDNSIGRFYAAGVNYLGYPRGWDAGKVMGLAPHGDRREVFEREFESLVDYGNGDYDVTAITRADDPVELFEARFGPRREPGGAFDAHHEDFAYHLQTTTERIVTSLVEHHLVDCDAGDLALAGGVALNCKLNHEIRSCDAVESLFVQPAANDGGICLGAALEATRLASGERPDPTFEHVYYGPTYERSAIEAVLDGAKVAYERVDDVADRTAALLAEGDIVGWFQGRMEYGPRALGNRSILADPRSSAFKDAVNDDVKGRESWRPFAPSLLVEAADEYLCDGREAPYMVVVDDVAPAKRDEIEAVVHVDGTTRPQTVTADANERYYRLIEAFGERTGVPVVLNTSFNVAGQPIVESPEQALATFYSTGLDGLAIGDFLVWK